MINPVRKIYISKALVVSLCHRCVQSQNDVIQKIEKTQNNTPTTTQKRTNNSFCNTIKHLRYLGRFPNVRTGRPDYDQTSQFANKKRLFQRVLVKNHFLCAHYLGFDLYGWIVLIKSEILTMMGMVWPVSSDK